MGFFNDLSKKATETYKTTTDKTSKIAKEMKLKSYIGECKSKINDVYAEIGKIVYEKHVLGESINIEEDLKNEIERIDSIAARVEAMNNEILTIKDLKVCEKCASEIGIDSKFCPKCGAKQQEKEESTTNSEVQPAVVEIKNTGFETTEGEETKVNEDSTIIQITDNETQKDGNECQNIAVEIVEQQELENIEGQTEQE